MSTLTDAEMLIVRKTIGDNVFDTRTSGYDLSPEEIQAIWDAQNGSTSEINAYRAYYKMLEIRLGMATNAVDTATESGGTSQRQKYLNIKDRMKDIEGKAGLGVFVMSVYQGKLDLGLDQDDPVTGANLDE